MLHFHKQTKFYSTFSAIIQQINNNKANLKSLYGNIKNTNFFIHNIEPNQLKSQVIVNIYPAIIYGERNEAISSKVLLGATKAKVCGGREIGKQFEQNPITKTGFVRTRIVHFMVLICTVIVIRMNHFSNGNSPQTVM